MSGQLQESTLNHRTPVKGERMRNKGGGGAATAQCSRVLATTGAIVRLGLAMLRLDPGTHAFDD
jgi:hypothetical protein